MYQRESKGVGWSVPVLDSITIAIAIELKETVCCSKSTAIFSLCHGLVVC